MTQPSIDVTGSMERIHRGRVTDVYRGLLADGRGVVAKVLRDPYPSPEQIAQLEREYRLTRRVQGPNVIEVVGIERSGGARRLLLEDFGAHSLAISFRDTQPTVELTLHLALSLVDALEHVHARHVVHKDVNPANVVWNPQTSVAKLIDFGIAASTSAEAAVLEPANVLEGTLAYISPEQTGRLNRHVDHRADYYGLGATLYELLTGRLPFDATEPLELVHAHVAMPPKPPHEVDSRVPLPLSRIVMKLLEKLPEDRYQSASGLRHDLERCLELLRSEDTDDFVPGRRDVVRELRVPARLYGRQAELRRLVSETDEKLTLVAGTSGVGKTALIDEVRRELATRRGRFVSGKLDQFGRGLPYASLITAIRDLVRQVLIEPDEDVARFRARVVEALGPNGRVLCDVVPELADVIGSTQPVAALPPEEAENRFLRTFQRFLAAVATANEPLVLFLDDLQWADVPTLRLVQRLLVSNAAPHLRVLGAYRSDEVDASHPLEDMVAALREAGVDVGIDRLEPLGAADVRALLSDTLEPALAPVDPLAERVIAKTLGNPFFLRRFLGALVDDGVLRFDVEGHGWTWTLEDIASRDVADNVVAFMSQRIASLPEATGAALNAAAMLGDTFDLEDLAGALELPVDAVRDALHPAVDEELVLPLREVVAEVSRTSYRFAHDRIQQAAASSSFGDQVAVHARIGRRLLARDDADARLFATVRHLHEAVSLLDEGERRQLAALATRAGERALESVAYQPALRYFEIAHDLGDPRNAEATRAALLGGAEAAYLSGDYDRMNRDVDELVQRASDPVDAARALWIRMRAHVSAGRLEDAVKVGLDALARLGVDLPDDPSKPRTLRELARTRWALRHRPPESRGSDPELEDVRWVTAMNLLAELAPPAYMAAPDLLPLIGFAMARIAAEHGVSATASYGYALYALVLCALGDYRRGARYGELAEVLGERFPDTRMKCRRAQLVQGFVRHWVVPVEECFEPLAEGFRLGVETGDFVWAAFCAQMHVGQRYTSGQSLDTLHPVAERYLRATRDMKQQHTERMLAVYAASVANLVDPACETPWKLEHTDEWRRELEATNNRTSLFNVASLSAILAVIFGRWAEARALAKEGTALLDAVPATHNVPAHLLFDALAHTGGWEEMSPREKGAFLARVQVTRSRFRRWSSLAPSNHEARRHLIDAELARVTGRRDAALRGYDRAIVAAQEHGRLLDEAMAQECASRFHAEVGNERLAEAFLREAAYAYERWGAHAKVAKIEEERPGLLHRETRAARETTTTTSGTSTGRRNLDATAVVKASQVLSEQLVLDEVVQSLVRIALEVSGATRAVLIARRAEGLFVESSAEAREEVVVERHGTPLDEAELPRSVVAYVERTRQDVVLDDAANDGLFVNDPYVLEHGPRSVLAVPVAHHGELQAVLYVENARHAAVFTPERVEVLRVLTSQAAISLENARLYENVERTLAHEQRMSAALSRFVPHQFLQALERTDITEVDLGDHVEKEMTILFSDIRGFTPIVAELSPAENIAFINEYLSYMEPPITDNGGFVDSYIGDAIMALFEGAPDAAIRAAVDMQRGLEHFNETRRVAGLTPVQTGIGLNSGRLMLGTIGGSKAIKCGVIGDSVNLASRVETATKHYGVPVLMSEHTHRRLQEPGRWTLREVERVITVGTSEPVMLYEVLEAEHEARREKKLETLETYKRAIALYFEGKFPAAMQAFLSVLSADNEDVVAQRYVDRCMTLVRDGVPDDWDGVVRLTSK